MVERKRLGNNSEAITAVHSGPLSGNIAIMDGTDVLVLPSEDEQEDTQGQKLFSVLGLGVLSGPRGIAYNETQ